MLTPEEVDRRPSLLLVDDCIAERDLYEIMLQPDFRVTTAARGSEGVRLATEPAGAAPDVILLDVMMPGLDGWEACARIKSHPRTADTPVILLTGSNERDLSQHAIAVGATAILKKPCPGDVLLRAISAALDDPQAPAPNR